MHAFGRLRGEKTDHLLILGRDDDTPAHLQLKPDAFLQPKFCRRCADLQTG